MPETPIYGLPYEHPVDDEPGHTLDGGSMGTEPILAQEVEDELERVDGDIADLKDRLAALEAGTSMVGWVPIQSGSTGASQNLNIDLTDGGRFDEGAFALVRLHMRFALSEEEVVSCRINGDSSDVYTSSRIMWDAADNTDITGHTTDLSRWVIGAASTVTRNNLTATFYHMTGNLFSFQSTCTRASENESGSRYGPFWGSLPFALSAPPSSLLIFPGASSTSGASFNNCWWWAEGYRVPS